MCVLLDYLEENKNCYIVPYFIKIYTLQHCADIAVKHAIYLYQKNGLFYVCSITNMHSTRVITMFY